MPRTTLVSLARSGARNSATMSHEPASHLLVGPRPLERVGVPFVVLGPGVRDVADELLAVVPRASLQVAITEGVDQQLRLVEPRGSRRRQPGPPPAVTAVEILRRRPGDVARPAVVDQVDAPQTAVPAAELLQSRDVVGGVILLQDRGPHASGVND